VRHRLAILAIVAALSAASAVVESALDGTPDFLRLECDTAHGRWAQESQN